MNHPSEQHGGRSRHGAPHPGSVARSGWAVVGPMGVAHLHDLKPTREAAEAQAAKDWPAEQFGDWRQWGVTVERLERVSNRAAPGFVYRGGCGNCGQAWKMTREEIYEVVSVPKDPAQPVYRYMAAGCPDCGHCVIFNRGPA